MAAVLLAAGPAARADSSRPGELRPLARAESRRLLINFPDAVRINNHPFQTPYTQSSYLNRHFAQRAQIESILPGLVMRNQKTREITVSIVGPSTGEEIVRLWYWVSMWLESQGYHLRGTPEKRWQIHIRAAEIDQGLIEEAQKRLRGKSPFAYAVYPAAINNNPTLENDIQNFTQSIINIVERDADLIEQTVNWIPGDVTTPETVSKMIYGTGKERRETDIIVNNIASIYFTVDSRSKLWKTLTDTGAGIITTDSFICNDGRQTQVETLELKELDRLELPMAGPNIYYLRRPVLNIGVLKGPFIGIDGNLYPEAVADQLNREDSKKRLEVLKQRIALEGRTIAAREGPVAGARWLLNSLIEISNCSDNLFRKNMPPHMREMEGLVRRLSPAPSDELLIAAMLHDADRLFDGFYVMMKDEPSIGGAQYKNYYKPIQHPRMASEFIRPLLELLGLDRRIIERVDILIRNHETGVSAGRADQALAQDSLVLMDTDAISMFTPVLLTNIFADLGPGEFSNAVRQKYSRVTPASRMVIDRLMEDRRGEYAEIAQGRPAYDIFTQVQHEARSALGVSGMSADKRENELIADGI